MLNTIETLTDDQLTDDLRTAHHTLTVSKARFLIALGEFAARELCRQLGAVTTAAWLSRECRIATRTAYEYLNVARQLRGFPLLAAKFLAGELSYSMVRLLLRYVTADNEQEYLDLAEGLSHEGLEQKLAGRPRNSNSGKNAREYFKVTTDEETGELRFWGRLSAERGAELLAALKTGELATLREVADLPESPKPEQLDALIEEARRTPEKLPGERVDEEEGRPSGPGTPEREPEGEEETASSVTRHGPPLRSRLLLSLLGVVAMVRSTPRRQVRAPGAEVHVKVAADGNTTLLGHVGAETRSLHRLLLNSRNHLHIVDDRGVTIRLGRAVRTVSAAQERALLLQWEGQCGLPGCVHSGFLEFHHIVAWQEGGGTDLDNLIPLCSGCHALVTAGIVQITIRRQDPARIWFTFPDGVTYVSHARRTPQRSTHPAPVQGELLPGDAFDDQAADIG